MVESLVTKLEQPLIITQETIEILKFHPLLITGNPHALVVTTMGGLFALANNHHLPIAIRPNGGVVGKIEIIQQLVEISRCAYVVFDQEIIVAAEGEVSVTPLHEPLSQWAGAAIGVAATFWLQHREKPFTGLTTAAFVLKEAARETVKNYNELASRVSSAIRQFDN